MDLETPETTPPVETPAPAPPDHDPAPATAPTATEEVDLSQVDVRDPKVAGIVAELTRMRAQNRELKPLKDKADAYDQMAGYVHQAQPYIEFLKAHPDLMTRTTQQTAPTPITTTQPVDEDAAELARTLDLYTSAGEPDVKRAQKLMAVVDRAADAKADAKVKPLVESTTRERSAYNYQRALVTKAPDGRAPDKMLLDTLWARTDPAITATEEGATALAMLALGMQTFQGQAPPPQAPQTAPVVTEGVGSRNPNRPTMTALDEKIAGMRGRSADEWSKLSRTFQPGRPNVLED